MAVSRSGVAAFAAAALFVGCTAACTSGDGGDRAGPASSPTTGDAVPTTQPPTTQSPTTPSASTSATAGGPDSGPGAEPAGGFGGPRVRPGAMLATIRLLAGRIGPREATSAAFARAAALVGRRLDVLGYTVTRQRFQVPAGVSWGVRVGSGTSVNVVATPPGLDPTRPHRIVGAHLDTVPQAPGAEDNASGIAVLLELARLGARPEGPGTVLPTRFVAFGAEEPRGDGDALHHFGSTAQVRRLSGAERAAIRAMVSLDRVGVGGSVPLCTGGLSPLRVRDDLLAIARRIGVPAVGCSDNTASDHWSYEKAGVTVARIGGTPYAAYHSAADVPGVPQPAQLSRVARLTWEWLRG